MSCELANFYRRTRAARKVIVVDLGFLGDTVHLVPSLWELRRAYPEAAVRVLTTPVGCEVLRLAPCADGGWGIELRPRARTLRQQWAVLREVRAWRPEVAFNFSGADRTLFMTALTGAPWRVAYAGARAHFWSRWLIPWRVPRLPSDSPVFERRRQMLAACGLELQPARFDLRVPAAARTWAASETPPGAIHLSLNASTPLKEWPLANWVELAARLGRRAGCPPLVVTGGNPDRERRRMESLAAAVKAPALRIYAGLSLDRLAALLERCVLHVGADSGVLHLAMALGLPTVSLFRDYPGVAGWRPSGARHRSLTVPCPCQGQKRPPCLEKENAACLAGLGPDEVLRLMDELVPALKA